MKTRNAAAYELIKIAVEITINRAEIRASDLDTLQRKKKEIISECRQIEKKRGRIIRHIDRLAKYQARLTADVATATDDEYRRRIKPRSRRSVELSARYAEVARRCIEIIESLCAVIREIDVEVRGRVLKVFSERLKAARKEQGLTQQQLADALGTTRDNISAYELSRNEPPITFLVSLSKFFGRPADWFLGS